jgi:hypothetical protein
LVITTPKELVEGAEELKKGILWILNTLWNKRIRNNEYILKHVFYLKYLKY